MESRFAYYTSFRTTAVGEQRPVLHILEIPWYFSKIAYKLKQTYSSVSQVFQVFQITAVCSPGIFTLYHLSPFTGQRYQIATAVRSQYLI